MKTNSRCLLTIYASSLFLGLPIFECGSQAATIWNGPTITYTQPGNDPTQAANQDHLTDNVWLTRGSSRGLFNAKAEGSFSGFFSPADTEWAYGQLADYASLTYTDWESWNGRNPPSSVGQDAVVHLKSDDVYLSIHFTFWGGLGGGFSYIRSTPPPPPLTVHLPIIGGPGINLTVTNSPGLSLTVIATTNLSLNLTNWTVAGTMTESPAGVYHFSETGAFTNGVQRYYAVRSP
ncbi:MAG TPA: hypothetical protein VN625_01995 [Desulfuromonadaceae bacterium]|nr:hypothetical protein [Desulfuromonadaceae bacterium]